MKLLNVCLALFVTLSSLGLSDLSQAQDNGRPVVAKTKPPIPPPAPPMEAAPVPKASPAPTTSAAENSEVAFLTAELQTLLKSDPSELAKLGLQVAAEIDAELAHGRRIVKLEQANANLSELRGSLLTTSDTQKAGLGKLRLNLETSLNAVNEKFADRPQERDQSVVRLVERLVPAIRRQQAAIDTTAEHIKQLDVRFEGLRTQLSAERLERDLHSLAKGDSITEPTRDIGKLIAFSQVMTAPAAIVKKADGTTDDKSGSQSIKSLDDAEKALADLGLDAMCVKPTKKK